MALERLQDRSRAGIPQPDRAVTSSKKATALIGPEWPLSVCKAAPVPVSHSLTMLSSAADASSLPFGEKATALMESEWSSNVCNKALQCSSTLGSLGIHLGTRSLNCFLTMLIVGANISALECVWSRICSIPGRLYKTNRFISWINTCRLENSLALTRD
jgi:hypothetical protein